MKSIIAIGMGLVMLACTGCATMMRGDKQKMKFETDPEGATVKVGDVEKTTPAQIPLKRKEKHEVTVSKAGYRTIMFELGARWDGASIGSFVLPGGTAWLAMDTASGADRNFDKLEKIKLEASGDSNAPPLKLIQWKGRLYNEEQFKKVMEQELEDQRWQRFE